MKLVCLGDSLTYGYGVPRSKTWPALAAESSGWEILNAGVNGDTTGGMLARFHTDALAHAPDAVLIMGGVNDQIAGCPACVMQANVAAMAQQAAARGVRPMVGLPPRVCEPMLPARWARLYALRAPDEALSAYLSWLDEFSRAFGVLLIDFSKAFDRAEAERPEACYLDGLHPSPLGHRLMAETLVAALGGADV